MDPNLRPEKQHAIPKQGRSEKLQVGQGRVGLRRRPDHINQPSDMTQGIPRGTKIETGKTNSSQGKNSLCDRAINNNNPFLSDVSLYQDLLHKPSPLHQNTNKINHNPDINLDFEEKSPFQEGVISEKIQRLDKSVFQNLRELEDLKGNLMLCKAVLGLQVILSSIGLICLGVILLHVYLGNAMQYTTAYLQVLFSLQLLGRITKNKCHAVITLN